MTLPVESVLPQLLAALESHPLVCLEAPPGTGKTTRVPLALMERYPGQILVLEPRKVAARWAAGYVASLLGERVGQRIGYQVRFDDRTGPDTRVVFQTQGVFSRRLRRLDGVSVVILDEFHERSLDNDLALAWLRKVGGPRVLLMSATLPDLPLERVRCEGVLHPVEMSYEAGQGDLEVRVAAAVAAHAPARDNSLIFLPGMREINACRRRLEPLAARRNAELLTLHGSQTAAEQDKVLSPGTGCRWILATNVAESSLTVPGVRAVFDSGLARSLSLRPDSPVPKLEVGRISRHSAVQRAGRAGRLGPGRCVRLYSEADFLARPESDAPEIARADLAGLRLMVARLGDPELLWLEPPEPRRWEAATRLLGRLGALDGGLTPLGQRMADLPVHPRLARMLLGCSEPGALATAVVLSERVPLESALDVMHIPPRWLELVSRMPAFRQLQSATRGLPSGSWPEALLTAFPDLVAEVRRGTDLLLCEGGSSRLGEGLDRDGFVIALDLEDNWGGGRAPGAASLRVYASLEPERLLERPELSESARLEWTSGRVERVERLLYGQLVLDDTRRAAPPSEEASRILAVEARKSAWFRALEGALTALEQRLTVLARLCPELDCQLDRDAWIEHCCQGFTSLRQLEERYPSSSVQPTAGLPSEVARALHRFCPPFVRLGKRQLQVHYEEGSEPWIASRLVDFFNSREGPTIGEGRLPLTLHLLAPNNRPVQITRDLAGFWERHYPKIRKELCRRYPRHHWPEDPLAAPTDWRPQRGF